MVRKRCELCGMAAKARCESDGADLCWECDAKVHGANFLVARHSRRLLCRSCQGPTPWRAEGPRLGPSVSVCLICFGRREEAACGASEKGEVGAAGRRSRVGEEEDEEEEEDVEDMEESDRSDDEDGDNQVVPWYEDADLSAAAPPRSPEPAARTSIGDASPPLSRRAPKNADPTPPGHVRRRPPRRSLSLPSTPNISRARSDIASRRVRRFPLRISILLDIPPRLSGFDSHAAIAASLR